MATKKKGATPPKDRWDDAREVLVVAGVPVLPPLEEGSDPWVGVYLGHVVKDSKYGEVKLHLMQTPDGHQGMWGSYAVDEGLGRATRGIETRMDFAGYLECDRGSMRLVRIRQLGGVIPSAPIIRDAQAEADAVYRELGIKPGEEELIDGETGEYIPERLNVSTSQV